MSDCGKAEFREQSLLISETPMTSVRNNRSTGERRQFPRQSIAAGSSAHRVSRVKNILKCLASVSCRTGMIKLEEASEKGRSQRHKATVNIKREELYAASTVSWDHCSTVTNYASKKESPEVSIFIYYQMIHFISYRNL